ncbi:MAG TPA: methyltransferase domain-containing protein [Solirubrobacteraceae bacterium]|nr:methyltransferase domain-containing protein [Solirubrobacteraceae bacterium]
MGTIDKHDAAAREQVAQEPPAIRQADARIFRQIHRALGDARSVANVGAGAAEYEPDDRWVLAIEPSAGIVARPAPRLTTPIVGPAESLPIPSNSIDAAMACLTLHQWADWRIGVQELRRVARKRVVIFTYDPTYAERFWLLRDYLPALGRLHSRRFPRIEEQCAATGDEVRVEPVPIPRDCHDGLLAAHWRRPSAYLKERVRAAIPTFSLPDAAQLLDGLDELAEDLRSGRWEQRNAEILGREQLDLGYRLLVTEL